MRRWSLLFVALAAVAGCAAAAPQKGREPVKLDALLAFDNPALCRESKTLARLMGAMMRGDANIGFRPGKIVVPSYFRPAFGKISVRREDGFWVVRVPVRGVWLGMPVLEMAQALPEGGDPSDVYFTLGVPVSEAETKLKAAGFPVVAGSAVSLGEPDGYDHQMSLYADPKTPGQSLFGCASS